ncbi:regulator of chromosome condensation [Anaeramoeba flamelloides]|uniref:Regulator of chromosome condensation n=1 Tax=Anaeramoeba flamelloides TaxID=1746091 RepID=A0AAV8AEC2_9EUKA|nr:regulator of chromosome condensation [Anaeramoeba flamelloides]
MQQLDKQQNSKKVQSKIFISGRYSDLSYLLNLKDEKNRHLPYLTCISKIDNQRKIKKILINGANRDLITWSSDFNCLVWKGKNKLELYFKTVLTAFEIQINLVLKNGEIKDIQCGSENFLILTKSGKVFSLSSYKTNTYPKMQKLRLNSIPLEDPKESTWEKLRPVPFFNDPENSRTVIKIVMCTLTNYFLCDGNVLYANGVNTHGQLGDGTTRSKRHPILISNNVKNVFSGSFSNNFFFTTLNNELFGCGKNYEGNLGFGNFKSSSTPQKIPDWAGDDILDIYCGAEASFLITNKGEIYGCGARRFNGIGTNKSKFTKIKKLRSKKVLRVRGGGLITFAFTNDNQLFCWGEENKFRLKDQYQEYEERRSWWYKPRQINLPPICGSILDLEISCGFSSSILYPFLKDESKTLKEDFKNLYETKIFYDSNLICLNSNKNGNGNENENFSIPIHKILLELRTNLKIEELQKIISKNNYSKKEIDLFLKWVYFDKLSKTNEIKDIFNSCNINYPPVKNSLDNDLLKLFKDEDSKDFHIIVDTDINPKERYGDEDDDLIILNKKQLKRNRRKNRKKKRKQKAKRKKRQQNNNYNNNRFQNVKVHKFILFTRSGLYRFMFNNLNKEEKSINQIQDYTGKSKQSLQILIKYLYTNKIELINQNINQKTVINELEDAIDYYQLNKNSNLNEQLNTLLFKENI